MKPTSSPKSGSRNSSTIMKSAPRRAGRAQASGVRSTSMVSGTNSRTCKSPCSFRSAWRRHGRPACLRRRVDRAGRATHVRHENTRHLWLASRQISIWKSQTAMGAYPPRPCPMAMWCSSARVSAGITRIPGCDSREERVGFEPSVHTDKIRRGSRKTGQPTRLEGAAFWQFSP